MPGSKKTRERFARFLFAVLAPKRSEQGWKKVEDLAKESGVSRASAYRYILHLESAGFPIERKREVIEGDRDGGVRCLVELRRAPAARGQA